MRARNETAATGFPLCSQSAQIISSALQKNSQLCFFVVGECYYAPPDPPLTTEPLSDDSYIHAIGAGDVPPGKMRAVEVAGHNVLICHAKDEFFAVENMCSHAMATLEDGRLRAYRLVCPLHGGSFDVRDGSAKGQPATRPIRTYPLRVVDDRIEVRIDSV
jgi:3-phenylpropionate/trans-cinnamate dioxygenase ferredoxin subunit